MNKVLFNLNDVALFLVIAESLLLVGLVSSKQRSAQNQILALLLASFAVDALATLLYWCEPLRMLSPVSATYAYLLLQFAMLAQGPLLFFYTLSLLKHLPNSKNFWMRHSMVLAIYIGLSIALFWDLGLSGVQRAARDYGSLSVNPYYGGIQALQVVGSLFYGCLSIWVYQAYKRALQDRYSSIEAIAQGWLQLLLWFYLATSLCHLFAGLANILGFYVLDHRLNVSGNYLDFVMVNAAVYFGLQHSQVADISKAFSGEGQASDNPDYEAPSGEPQITATNTGQPLPQQDSNKGEQIRHLVRQRQLYLDPEINLEQAAKQLEMSPRLISNTINQELNLNFFEFINLFRIEHAQALLRQEPGLSIQQVMESSGFNSKTAFNRGFKKTAGMTPSDYRRKHASAP